MAFSYIGVANTPCSIIRSVTALVGDGSARNLRVGDENCPLPTGWTDGDGTPVNAVFFAKLKEVAMRLTGAANENALSGASIPAIYLLAQAPNASYLASLQGLYPNGQLLDAPFIENVTPSIIGGNPGTPFLSGVIFEDTGGTSAPTYADFIFAVTAANSTYIFEVKLFHSLTR